VHSHFISPFVGLGHNVTCRRIAEGHSSDTSTVWAFPAALREAPFEHELPIVEPVRVVVMLHRFSAVRPDHHQLEPAVNLSNFAADIVAASLEPVTHRSTLQTQERQVFVLRRTAQDRATNGHARHNPAHDTDENQCAERAPRLVDSPSGHHFQRRIVRVRTTAFEEWPRRQCPGGIDTGRDRRADAAYSSVLARSH